MTRIRCPVCGEMVSTAACLKGAPISETIGSRNGFNRLPQTRVGNSMQKTGSFYATIHDLAKHGNVFWCCHEHGRSNCMTEFSRNGIIYRYKHTIQLGLEDV